MLVTFTGYACTNCHWMKANMFPRPEIASVVKDMILVELFTDGTDEAPRTNQKLQEKTFSTVADPLLRLDGRRWKSDRVVPGPDPRHQGVSGVPEYTSRPQST